MNKGIKFLSIELENKVINWTVHIFLSFYHMNKPKKNYRDSVRLFKSTENVVTHKLPGQNTKKAMPRSSSMFLFTQMAGHSVLNQPKLRALCSQQRYLAHSVWYKRKIIQQAGISPSYFRPRWVGWFGFGHFHYLLALKPKLVKEGSLKISTHWYWSARLVSVRHLPPSPARSLCHGSAAPPQGMRSGWTDGTGHGSSRPWTALAECWQQKQAWRWHFQGNGQSVCCSKENTSRIKNPVLQKAGAPSLTKNQCFPFLPNNFGCIQKRRKVSLFTKMNLHPLKNINILWKVLL